MNPRCKPRHEVINVNLHTEQKKSAYCDVFQDPGYKHILHTFRQQHCLFVFSLPMLNMGSCLTVSSKQTSTNITHVSQEGTWISVTKYWDKYAPEDLKKKRKTLAAKKARITKVAWLCCYYLFAFTICRGSDSGSIPLWVVQTANQSAAHVLLRKWA